MTSLRSLGLIFAVSAVAVLLTIVPIHAQTALSASFNHFTTGFPLTGTHLSVACASCHVNGRFANTPKLCIDCHNSMTAPGEPQSHPRTTTLCEYCHQTATWRDYRFIDHVQALGSCASCHNNKLAQGKSNAHIPTELACNVCHLNTVTWAGAITPRTTPVSSTPVAPAVTPVTKATPPTTTVPTPVSSAAATNSASSGSAASKAQTALLPSNAIAASRKPNHAAVISACVTCHNGVAATGKRPNHLVTSAPCESCHKSSVTFAGARVDHSRITAPCASCHNGATAEGKPSGHFLTGQPCETCHRATLWTPVIYRHTSPSYVNHGPGVSCNSCHASNAQTVEWKFPALRPNCAGCHLDKYRPMAHLRFGRPVKVYYTASELRDCTGACHSFADNTQRVVLTRSFGVHHALGDGW